MSNPTPTAAPVISPIQSVLGYLQWQPFEFQPSAINFPIEWFCSPLPPGLYFDSSTGKIIGAVTVPGVYVFTLYAQNSVGLSQPQTFVMGIEASGNVQPANVLDLIIDVGDRTVSLAGSSGSGGNDTNLGDDEKLAPLFWAKTGDDLVMNIGFVKGGVAFAPDITGLKFALKEVENEDALISSQTWSKVGVGDSATFNMVVHLDGDSLRGEIDAYETDFIDPDGSTRQMAASFLAFCEFEWTENNTLGIGSNPLRSSSRTFGVMIVRDLIPNS